MVRIKVLFVDDDEFVLSGIRRMLRSSRNEWDASFSSSAADALSLLERDHYDVVVSDMRMPEMDGAQLQERVREMSPMTLRVILSGQTDDCLQLHTVESAEHVLSKPCSPEALMQVIAQKRRV